MEDSYDLGLRRENFRVTKHLEIGIIAVMFGMVNNFRVAGKKFNMCGKNIIFWVFFAPFLVPSCSSMAYQASLGRKQPHIQVDY